MSKDKRYVDLSLLREQRERVLKLLDKKMSNRDVRVMEGVLSLLEGLQDDLEDRGMSVLVVKQSDHRKD